jgi:glycosyltransferase involved in cell wall biosynthesis
VSYSRAPIVCFSSNDWTDIPSSKFHIMRHLGRTHAVLWIDTIGLRSPKVSSRDARRAWGKLKRIFRGTRHVETNVYVWSPPALPFHGVAAARRFNAWLIPLMIRRVMRRLGMSDAVIWTYMPNAIDVVERLPKRAVIYHCIDDYGEFTDVPKAAFEAMEQRMLRRADLTVVSARKLEELRAPYARRTAYVPHGVNLEEFQRALEHDAALPDIDGLPRPIAGFVGRIADWIDLDLVARCARAMPDWSFVFVGPSIVDLSPYEQVPNMHFLGQKDHAQVPNYIRRFDVALMPFAANEVAASVNPLKMYEYLAVGVPVVTVPMQEVEDYRQWITIAEAGAWETAIQAAHDEDSDERRAERVASVSQRSWGAIAETILRELEA